VQRAYRARLKSAGKAVRIVDATASPVPIPDFDPAKDGVFEREMIALCASTFATDWHGTGGTQIRTNVGVDLSAACHVYGMEYNPGNWLKMYLDGRLMATYTTDIPTEPYEIILDLDIAGPERIRFPQRSRRQELSRPI